MTDRPVRRSILAVAFLASVTLFALEAARADSPPGKPDLCGAQWIWPQVEGQPNTGCVRKTFQVEREVVRADFAATCDNGCRLYLNGQLIAESRRWETPIEGNMASLLLPGENVLAAELDNEGDTAGFILELRIEYASGAAEGVITDGTWRGVESAQGDWRSGGFDDSAWKNAAVIGTYPCEPWREALPLSYEHLIERIKSFDWLETPEEPDPSRFAGEYLDPTYAALYADFVTVGEDGVLRNATGAIAPITTIYAQTGPRGQWTLGALAFDYDQVERDFAAMKKAGVNIYLRMVSWGELLNPDGSWTELTRQPVGTDLPQFRYNVDVYDYFLDRAQAHGLYVTLHPSHHWGMNLDVIPRNWHDRYCLYDDLWEITERAYERIMRHFADRSVVVVLLTGEESLQCGEYPDEPETLRRFREFLRKRYGTVANLKKTWRWGYDYDDHSLWAEERTKNGDVLYKPFYPFVKGAYSQVEDFDDIRIPPYEMWRRGPGPLHLPARHRPLHMETVPKEPAWIDYYRMKQELMLARVNSWARMLRRACPEHLIQFSSGFDHCAPWLFFQVFDRARLEYDIIGVGQHDSNFEPWELAPWQRVRAEVQNVAAYWPYVRAKGSPARGVGTGEGCGGSSDKGFLLYWKGWMFDLFGGGVGLANTYAWGGLTSRPWSGTQRYDTPVLEWLAHFTPIADRTRFTRPQPPVVIIRSRNMIRSQSAGYDIGNTTALASHLSQLHIPYDIVDDESLTMDPDEEYKVYLGQYDFVFVSQLFNLLPAESWELLEEWVSSGGKGMCLPYFELQDEYFNPVTWDELPDAARLLLGADYARRTEFEGVQDAEIVLGETRRIALEFPKQWPANGEAGLNSSEDSTLQPVVTCNGEPIVTRHVIANCQVYRCGFATGMAYNALWGIARYPKEYDSLARIFGLMLAEAGITADIEAPHNLIVRISDDLGTILVKERFGIFTEELLGNHRSSPRIYADGGVSGVGVRTVKAKDGTVSISRPLDGYDACILKAIAVIEGEAETFDVESRRLPNGRLSLISQSPESLVCRLVLEPETTYVIDAKGIEPLEATSDAVGTLQIPLFPKMIVLITPAE